MTEYENWLGQRIFVGDIVFNGQRDGNSSIYRYGRVTGFSKSKNGNVLAQVEWIAERGGTWVDSQWHEGARKPWTKASSLSADNVVVVDPSVVNTTRFVPTRNP